MSKNIAHVARSSRDAAQITQTLARQPGGVISPSGHNRVRVGGEDHYIYSIGHYPDQSMRGMQFDEVIYPSDLKNHELTKALLSRVKVKEMGLLDRLKTARDELEALRAKVDLLQKKVESTPTVEAETWPRMEYRSHAGQPLVAYRDESSVWWVFDSDNDLIRLGEDRYEYLEEKFQQANIKESN